MSDSPSFDSGLTLVPCLIKKKWGKGCSETLKRGHIEGLKCGSRIVLGERQALCKQSNNYDTVMLPSCEKNKPLERP